MRAPRNRKFADRYQHHNWLFQAREIFQPYVERHQQAAQLLAQLQTRFQLQPHQRLKTQLQEPFD